MEKMNSLEEIAKHLMSQDPQREKSEEEQNKLEKLAEKTGKQFGWDKFCDACTDFLYNECKTEQQVTWFAVNVCRYIEYFKKLNYIKEPIKFLSYLYYKVDVEKDDYSCTIFETLAWDMLPNIESFDRWSHFSQEDPRLKKGIEKWKSGEYK